MPRPVALALAVSALFLAAIAGYLSFGRSAPPSSAAIPASPDAVATADGAEVARP